MSSTLSYGGAVQVMLSLDFSEIGVNFKKLLNLFTVPLKSKLTLVCGNTRVFLYFCQVTQSELTCDARVNFRVEHASSILCATRDPSSCAA